MKKNNDLKFNIIFIMFLKIIFVPLRIINFFVPKNKNVWIFGSSSGDKFFDNSKYLYKLVSKQPKCKAVWLTKNKKIINHLQKNQNSCYHFYSLKGIYYSILAKYVFLSYSYNDVGFFCYLFPRKTKIIQLFHGTPLKRLEIERNRSQVNINTRRLLRFYIEKKYDLITSTSDLVSEKMDIYFKVGKEKYIITGYPRNDILFEKKENDFLNQIKSKQNFSKVIFYLPTYREYTDKDSNFNLFDNFGFDKEKLNYILEKNNAIFLVKLHFRDYAKTEKIMGSLQNSERIYFIKDEQIDSDIYPLLSHTDVLITDYSSVYFDFLLLNRPIIFSAFDLDEYEKYDRGFYFNYDKITPGPKIKDWKNLIIQLDKSLTKPEKYQTDRNRVNLIVNKFRDGDSSRRIYKYIENNF